MSADDVDDEELKRLKRDAAIRAKESDFIRKQKEEEDAKRQQLQELKQEYERQEQNKLEERLKLLKKQAEVRAQKKAENDRLVRKRDEAIEMKKQTWKENADAKIQQTIEEHKEEEVKVELAQAAARDRKHAVEAKLAEMRIEEKGRQWNLDQKRQLALEARAAVSRQKELQRVDRIKAEAHAELQSFIQNPFPVPLRQVLAGRMRPVPGVTELLAAHKDQREQLKELEAQNIPLRALMRNQSLFQYVRDIQLEAEANAVRPPEPAGMNRGKSRTEGSSTRKNLKMKG